MPLHASAKGEAVGGMAYNEAMALIDTAGRPLLLTFKRVAHRDAGDGGPMGGPLGGPVLIEGDLLKLEPNLFASIVGDKTKEAHRRYFVVRPDHVTLAVGETVILLHPPFHLLGVLLGVERGC